MNHISPVQVALLYQNCVLSLFSLFCFFATAGTKGGISESSTLHSLWFKFNEGFSNAVRRPMHVKDLL